MTRLYLWNTNSGKHNLLFDESSLFRRWQDFFFKKAIKFLASPWTRCKRYSGSMEILVIAFWNWISKLSEKSCGKLLKPSKQEIMIFWQEWLSVKVAFLINGFSKSLSREHAFLTVPYEKTSHTILNQKKKSFSLWVSNALVILSVWFNQNLTPTSVDTCVSSSKDTVWARKNAYEQVQNGEMGLSLIKMFFHAPNVEGKNRRQETVGLHLL